MFIAMNRFQVILGEEDAFEQMWLSRDSYLASVSGFVEFHMLRGPATEAMFSTLRIRSGGRARTSRPGRGRKHFGRRTAVLEATSRSISDRLPSKGSTSCRP